VCFSFTNNLYAHGPAGGEISYSCTNTPGVWKVKLVLYRDCSDLQLGNCMSCGSACGWTLKWSTIDSGWLHNGSFTVMLTSVSDLNPIPQYPSGKSICTNTGCVTAGIVTPGIEKFVYEGEVNLGSTILSTTLCNVRIYFDQGSQRHGYINTGPAGENFYIEAIINRCDAANNPCSSSPELTNDPIAVICNYQSFVFNNGAIDPEHDSITYAFSPALTDHGTSATYTSPYTYDAPMPYSGTKSAPFPLGISCDRQTGDIMFRPSLSTVPFVGVINIEIKQWRTINGVPTCIGITHRDMQMWIYNCSANNYPELKTNPSNGSLPKFNWGICAGNQLCFNVIGKDTDFHPSNTPPVSDTTYLSWNNALSSKGATFLPTYNVSQRSTNGPREDNYQFCWTPSEADISSIPYYFNVNVADNRYPNFGRMSRSFSVTVYPKADVTINKHFIKCAKCSLNFVNNNPSQNFASIVWQISKVANDFRGLNVNTYKDVQTTPTQQFSDTGKYVVELDISTLLGSCTSQFFDTIYNTILYRIEPGIDTTLCSGTPIQLKANYAGGKEPLSFMWYDTLQKNTSLSSLDSLIISPTTSTQYIFKITDSWGCVLSDTSTIHINSVPKSTLPVSSRICEGTNYTLDAGNNSGNIKRYFWSTGDTSRTITRSDSNTFWIRITDTLGCEKIDTLALFVTPMPKTNAGTDDTICYGQTKFLQATGADSYTWFKLLSAISLSDSSNLIVAPTVNTTYRVLGTIKIGGVSCNKYGTVKIAVDPLPKITVGNDTSICIGQSVNLQASGAGIYNWYEMFSSSSFGNSSTVNIAPTVSSFYRVIGTDIIGGVSCSNADTIKVNVNPLPKINAGNDTTICNGQTFILDASGAANYKWFTLPSNISIGDSSKLTISPNQTTNYRVIGTDNLNCTNADSVQIKVNPKPANPIITGPNTVIINKSNNYSVFYHSGNSYNWFLTNGIINGGNGTEMVNINFTTPGTQKISVTEIENNCASDTAFKTVEVINEPNGFNHFKVFPNPTTSSLNIEFETAETNVGIELFDMLGKSLLNTTVKHPGGIFKETLELWELSEAIYTLRITINENSRTVKVFVCY
jgi:Secretion system C-terminal sorting domain